MSREEILLDALEYYTVDPDNRRCALDDDCYYSPKTIGKEETSEGCLIGRLLSPELALQIDDKENEIGINTLIEENKYPLPSFMNKDNSDFLLKCQRLHDGNGYWTSTGLSSDGVKFLSGIIEWFGLDDSKFSKFLN